MTLTDSIILNAFLFVAIVATLIWLLGYKGVQEGVRHEKRMLRWHSLRAAAQRRRRPVA